MSIEHATQGTVPPAQAAAALPVAAAKLISELKVLRAAANWGAIAAKLRPVIASFGLSRSVRLAGIGEALPEELMMVGKASTGGPSRRDIVKFAKEALEPVAKGMRASIGDAVVGFRGSLATGIKFKTKGLFTSADFDVDAFVISDDLAK
jgi:hypothetical protein